METIHVRQIFKLIRTCNLKETDYLIQHQCTVGDFCRWYIVGRALKLRPDMPVCPSLLLDSPFFDEPFDTEPEQQTDSGNAARDPMDPQGSAESYTKDGEPDDTSEPSRDSNTSTEAE